MSCNDVTNQDKAAPLIHVLTYSLAPDLPHDLDRCVPPGCTLHMSLLPFLHLHLLLSEESMLELKPRRHDDSSTIIHFSF
jgi:hypothetical protein